MLFISCGILELDCSLLFSCKERSYGLDCTISLQSLHILELCDNLNLYVEVFDHFQLLYAAG